MANDYRAIITEAAKRYGIDPNLLLRQAQQESAFNPLARSPAGAAGLLQQMPGTALHPGFGVKPMSSLDDRLDPYKSADQGAQYMAAMLKRYGGDVNHALIAYNWGPGNADAYRAGRKKNLPAETQDYVRKITGNKMFGGNPRAASVDAINTMTGERTRYPGQPGPPYTPPMAIASDRRPSANRRDAVELAPQKKPLPEVPSMSFFDGFLDSGRDAGLLDRIGGGLAAMEGRHPTQLAMQEQALRAQQIEAATQMDPTERFAYAVKIGADPEMALGFADTGDINILGGIDPTKLARGDSGNYGYQDGGVFQTEDGRMVTRTFNRDTGKNEIVDLGTGLTRVQDAGEKKRNELNAVDENTAAKDAETQYTRLSNIDRMYQLTYSGSMGPGAAMSLARFAAKNLGIDVGDISAEEMDRIAAIQSQFELDGAQLMKGQGQITENERKIIARLAPQIDTDPEAAREILRIMSDVSKREIATWEEYDDAPPEQKADGYAVFKARKARRERKQQTENVANPTPSGNLPQTEEEFDAYVDSLPSGATFVGPDGKTYRKE